MDMNHISFEMVQSDDNGYNFYAEDRDLYIEFVNDIDSFIVNLYPIEESHGTWEHRLMGGMNIHVPQTSHPIEGQQSTYDMEAIQNLMTRIIDVYRLNGSRAANAEVFRIEDEHYRRN